MQDAYKSVYEALAHASFYHSIHIDSDQINLADVGEKLQGLHGVLIPIRLKRRGW